MQEAKNKVIELIQSGKLTKENGKEALQILAAARKGGQSTTLDQVLESHRMLKEVARAPVSESSGSTKKFINPKNPDEKYYSHSGAVGITGPILFATVGLLVTALMAWVYGYAVYYIPLIYINFFITLFFGGGVGFLIGWLGKVGKVRNNMVMLLSGLALGLFANYFQWVAAIAAISGDLAGEMVIVFSPLVLFEFMGGLADTGYWTIFGWTPTGWAMYLFWWIEFFIIVGGATLIAMGFSSEEPYCENCDDWVKDKYQITNLNPVGNPLALVQGMEQDNFEELMNLEKAMTGSRQFTQLTLTHCSGCNLMHFISVSAVSQQKNEDGEDETEVDDYVTNMIISEAQHNQFKETMKGSAL
jgi:hypothetical protein